MVKSFQVFVVSVFSTVLVFSPAGVQARDISPDFYYLENGSENITVYSCFTREVPSRKSYFGRPNSLVSCPTITEITRANLDQFAADLASEEASLKSEQHYPLPLFKYVGGVLTAAGVGAGGFIATLEWFMPPISGPGMISKRWRKPLSLASLPIVIASVALAINTERNYQPIEDRQDLAEMIGQGVVVVMERRRDNLSPEIAKRFSDFLNEYGRPVENPHHTALEVVSTPFK